MSDFITGAWLHANRPDVLAATVRGAGLTDYVKAISSSGAWLGKHLPPDYHALEQAAHATPAGTPPSAARPPCDR